MAAKKESNNNANQSWWNQLDVLEEIEKNSIQAIENQKEWVKGTREQLSQLEENSKKLTTEWTANAQKFLIANNKDTDNQEWLKKLEDIGHKSQQIAFLPGKTSLEMFSKSTEQFEETFVKVTEQNKKVLEETTKTWDGMFDQIKQTQKGMLQFFPFSPIASK